VTPELFALTICQDFDLAVEPFAARIATAINDRVRESELSLVPQSGPVDGADTLSEEDVQWWKRMRQEALLLDETAEDEEDRPLPVEDLTEDVGEMPFDLRIKIQVSNRSCKERLSRDGSHAPACYSLISSLVSCILRTASSGTYNQILHPSSSPRFMQRI
jgi:hypothetical protein